MTKTTTPARASDILPPAPTPRSSTEGRAFTSFARQKVIEASLPDDKSRKKARKKWLLELAGHFKFGAQAARHVGCKTATINASAAKHGVQFEGAQRRYCKVCSKRIALRSLSGLCREHSHTAGICKCLQCTAPRRAPAVKPRPPKPDIKVDPLGWWKADALEAEERMRKAKRA